MAMFGKEERLQNLMSHVAAKCWMKNWTHRTGQITEVIENYFGFLLPVTVYGLSEDTNNELAQHVFVKLPPLEDSLRAFSGYLWDTEVYLYSNLIPTWERLSKKRLDELFPICYYANATPNEQVLVLEDMRYKDFRKYPDRFLDCEHIVVSLKSLAQFHAFSIIMKNNNMKLDAHALRPYTQIWPLELNITLQNSLRLHSPLFMGSRYEHFLRMLLTNYESIILESTTKANYLVYGHGDYWKENILYKYESSKPIAACIIDFQCCRVMSPAHDFLFFILNCSNATIRRLHFKLFLTEYYDNLKNTLLENGIEIETFYPIEDFISDLKVVAPICMIRICLAFSLWLGFETDSLVKSKNSVTSEQNSGKSKEDLQFLKEIFTDIMQDLSNYGYINL